MNKARRTAMALAGTAAAFSLIATGCSSGDGDGGGAESAEPIASDAFDEAMSTPTELTFWTWVPDIENEIALFEEAYPAMDVTVENVGQGLEHYQKLRSALESGEGAPDVAQIEYMYIPTFNLTNSLLDLSQFGARDLGGDYVEWVWNQVANDAGVWAIPQDTGPMGNLYREDILAEAGLDAAPETYDEYAEAAQLVKDETGSYISNLAANEPVQLIALLWQAGIDPFGYDGAETVSIDVSSAEVKEIVQYWQDLVQADLVSTDAGWTDNWFQNIANGNYAGWLVPAWGPIFLQGTAEGTAGKWRAAPLPQWDAANPVSGNWGGSSNAVLATSENPIAAYELARWINYEPEPTTMFATEQFLYPALTSLLEDPEYADQPVEFFGGQEVNAEFAEISATVDPTFEWLPFMEYVLSSYNETVGAAWEKKGDAVGALDVWQQELVDYATEQGFTVE
ncbi:extracellular solute-binding protein [Demequina sp. SYSU T00192]|uniref:Extracellular solute-binding protein n=1 Tax=Demequina litoralis TaxID=3051660 RepID=A0ABT8GBA0_9MICO|nr:extracellular solute-binding protein [Demequina sp. SYSU T00192]MDN4476337.1 extracellular solute-binding protein [Demequina sp. SYSU T00192]